MVPVLVSWCAMGLAAALVIGAARALHWSKATTGALLLVGVLGNTSFLGLAVVQWALGDRALSSAIAYDQLGSFLALTLYGAVVVSAFAGTTTTWRSVFGRIVRFVPFLALAASPVVAVVGPPHFFYSFLDVPGFSVAPVAMFGLGMRFPSRFSARAPVVVALTAKMIVVPGFVFVCASLWGLRADAAWSASILQAAMPPMVTAGLMAVSAGFDEELVSSTVGIGTLVAAVTLPLWSLIVG